MSVTRRLKTRLKFTFSEKDNLPIAFISIDNETKKVLGVRREDNCKKQIVLVDKAISHKIEDNKLYEATLIPMASKKGFVAIEISPIKFKATIEEQYLFKVLYVVEAKFGNKRVRFDPLNGKKLSMRCSSECVKYLKEQTDILNKDSVIEEFAARAAAMEEKFYNDFECGKVFA